MADHKTRKLKVLRVDPLSIVEMLNGQRREFVMLPQNDVIPAGTEVLAVRDNFHLRCIDMLLTHESWPEVPDGELPPDVGELFHMEHFQRVPSPYVSAEEFRKANSQPV